MADDVQLQFTSDSVRVDIFVILHLHTMENFTITICLLRENQTCLTCTGKSARTSYDTLASDIGSCIITRQ